MRFLFYLYPGVLPQGPDFSGGWTWVLSHLAGALGAVAPGSCMLVTANRFVPMIPPLPGVTIAGIDELELQRAIGSLETGACTPSELARLAITGANSRHPAISALLDRIRTACGDFHPDVVLTFSMRATYLQALWDPVVIMNVEAGAFSRPPYEYSLYFDHWGIYRSSAFFRMQPGAEAPYLNADALDFASDFRQSASQALAAEDPFASLDLRGKFDRLALLPLQVSNWHSFDDQAKYRTQFEYLFDVMAAAPAAVGVIVTEYIQWGNVLRNRGSGSNWAFLRNAFPNLIFLPDARQYASPSQYLVEKVDGVYTVSSNLGCQGLLFGKRLGTNPESYLANLAHDIGPENFFSSLSAKSTPADRTSFLAWYLTRYVVPQSLYLDGRWLRDYFERRLHAIAGSGDPLDGFVEVAEPGVLRRAWLGKPLRDAPDRWMGDEDGPFQ